LNGQPGQYGGCGVPPHLWVELDRLLGEIQVVQDRLELSYPDRLILARVVVFILTKEAWDHYDQARQDFLDLSTRWTGDGGADHDDPPLPPVAPPWPRLRKMGL
jgi:hypothetical protein